MLRVLAAYIPQIPSLAVDGIFGPATEAAVTAFQRWAELPQTGVVNNTTWSRLYDQFSGIEQTSLNAAFPYTQAVAQNGTPRSRYNQTGSMTQFPGGELRSGSQDRQEVQP